MILHVDAVTVYTIQRDNRDNITGYTRSIIDGVHIEQNRAAIMAKYGPESNNKAEVYFYEPYPQLSPHEAYIALYPTNDPEPPKDALRVSGISTFKLIPHIEVSCE